MIRLLKYLKPYLLLILLAVGLLFVQANADLAHGTIAMSDHVREASQRVFNDLLHEGSRGTRPIKDLYAMLLILYRIRRVGSQAKNICEETIFVCTGQIKEPKVHHLLFLDESDGARI